MNGYVSSMKRYADFTGRTGRAEFLSFQLTFFGMLIGLFIVIAGFGTRPLPILGLVVLVHLLPYVSSVARRMHDLGMSGFFSFVFVLFFLFAPFLLATLVLGAIPGQKAANRFGAVPGSATPEPFPPITPPGMETTDDIHRAFGFWESPPK